MSVREWIGTIAFWLAMVISAAVVIVSIVALWVIEPLMGGALTGFALLLVLAAWGNS